MAESLEYTELEARYQRYREILKNLTLMSDIFMRNVLKQKECTEHMCKEMDQIYQEGAVQGRKEGEMTAKKIWRCPLRVWAVGGENRGGSQSQRPVGSGMADGEDGFGKIGRKK